MPADLCPVCGRPNQCAPAACGSFDVPCWCRDVRVTPQALARVPATLRGRACLCPRCAQAVDAPSA